MQTLTPRFRRILSLGAVLLCASPLAAQNLAGQWDFDKGDLTATAGPDLTYADGPGGATQQQTHFGTTSALGIPAINGVDATVMEFPPATDIMGYFMSAPAAPNAGGSLVNEWSLVMDVLYPGPSDGIIRPIIDTDGNADVAGPEFVVGATDGVGPLPNGPFLGKVAPNTWYRLGIAVKNSEMDVYLNGSPVGVLPGYALDGRFAMTPGTPILIFGNTVNTNAAIGYLNSLQLWDAALSAGQMLALGGPSAAGMPTNLPPVPAFVQSQTPRVNDTGVGPQPNINVVLNQGSTTVNASSIALEVDGSVLPATVTATPPTFTVAAAITNLLDPGSVHSITLAWSDTSGPNSASWSFTVANYQNITLPTPIYLETFDEVAEGGVPAGWTVTNWTDTITPGLNLLDTQSDSYKDWVVVSTNTYVTAYPDTDNYTSPGFPNVAGNRRMMIPPIVLNGQLLSTLANGNLIVAESDQRSGSQVQVLFTKDFDLTGHTNVFLSFHHINEQNQDNICSVEYSVDQGQTWLPLLYMLDDGTTDTDGSDVVTNATTHQIDVFATFGTARSDQAHALAYGTYIGAAVSTNLIPYIRGCRNDDPVQQKRIEIFRLAQADNQAKVRFRLMQAGTGSWFFDVDDFGLYEINTPVISTQPQSQTVDAATPATFTVVASSASPLTYQWRFQGSAIIGATNSSYTIPSAAVTNAGQYQVSVGNSDGITKSSLAALTIVTTPQVVASPISQVTDAGSATVISASARGGRPLGFFWIHDGSLVANSASTNLSLPSPQAGDSGAYQLVATNSYGSITSVVAQVTVVSGVISNGLVVHLSFDGNLNDASGRGNNAQYASNGTAGDPAATFAPGQIGQAFEFTTLNDGTKFDYATLGYPDDLRLGDSTSFSVSFWVNYTNQSDDLPFISNKDWNSSGNQGWGIFSQSAGDFRVNATGPNGGSDKYDVHPATILRDGAWHNLVLSVVRGPAPQAGYVYAYVDGALVNRNIMVTQGSIDSFALPFTNEQGPGGGAAPNNQTAWAVNIGQDGTGVYHDQGSAYNIGAKIDDLGIWRRALSAGEAAAIFTAGHAGKDLSQAVVSQAPPKVLIQAALSGGSLALTWPGAPNVKLQTTMSLSAPNWTDVPNTLGASSASVPLTGTAAFFRLSQ